MDWFYYLQADGAKNISLKYKFDVRPEEKILLLAKVSYIEWIQGVASFTIGQFDEMFTSLLLKTLCLDSQVVVKISNTDEAFQVVIVRIF